MKGLEWAQAARFHPTEDGHLEAPTDGHPLTHRLFSSFMLVPEGPGIPKTIQRKRSMFCRHCGSEVKDKAVVCSGCGENIGDGESTLLIGEAGPKAQWSWFTMFVTIGVITLLLLIAIIAGL